MKAIELDEQLLIFRVGPVACCVAARDIDSIVNAQALHKLPRQADFIAGVLQYRETAVSIVNLFHKFALSTPETPLHGRFVMAYTRHGVTGFWVDEIIEITNDFEQNWSSAPSFLEEKVFDRTLLWHDKLILQTDFDRLFAMKASGALSEWANKNDTNWDIRKADSVKVKAVDNEEASYKANAESELIISDLVTRGTVFSQPVVSLVSTFDEDNPDLIPPQFTTQNTASDLAMEEHSIGLEEVFNGNNEIMSEIISEVEPDQVLDVDSKTALTNENTNKIPDEVLNETTINNEGRSEASSIDVTTSLISTSTNNDTVFELVIQEKDSVLVEDMSNVNSGSTDALLSEVSSNVESDVVDENQLDLDLTLSGVDEEKSKDIEVLNLDTQLESFSEPDYHIDSSLVIDLSRIEEDVEQGFRQSDVNDTSLDRSILSNSTFDNHSNSSNLVMKVISDPETEIEINFDLVSDIASDAVPESTPNTTSSKSDFDSIGPVPFSDETVTLDFISEENDHFLVDDSEVFIDKADSTKTKIIDSLAANFEEDVEGYFAKNLDEQISIYQKSVESQLLALAGKTEKEKEREENKQEEKQEENQEENQEEKKSEVPQKELLKESKISFVDEDISKSGIDVESKNETIIDSFSTFEKSNVNKFDLDTESELSDLEIRTNQSTFTALVDEDNNKSEITSLEEFSENPGASGFGGNESVDWHGSDSKGESISDVFTNEKESGLIEDISEVNSEVESISKLAKEYSNTNSVPDVSSLSINEDVIIGKDDVSHSANFSNSIVENFGRISQSSEFTDDAVNEKQDKDNEINKANDKERLKKEEAVKKVLERIENNSPDRNRSSRLRFVASVLAAATGVFLAEHYGLMPDNFNFNSFSSTKIRELVLLNETPPVKIEPVEQIRLKIETVTEKFGEDISVSYQLNSASVSSVLTVVNVVESNVDDAMIATTSVNDANVAKPQMIDKILNRKNVLENDSVTSFKNSSDENSSDKNSSDKNSSDAIFPEKQQSISESVGTPPSMISETKVEKKVINVEQTSDIEGDVSRDSINSEKVNVAKSDMPARKNISPPVFDIHNVVRGDTLWAIAGTYLHNPFRYPDLARWSNIKNPDLIYPGNEVKYISPEKEIKEAVINVTPKSVPEK